MPVARQNVATLPLAPNVRHRLLVNGFTTTSDFSTISAADLSKEANLTEEQAHEVLHVAGASSSGPWGLAGAHSAAGLLAAVSTQPRILSFAEGLDRVLGGGVHTGNVTEFCGVPGVGKTQIGIQLAVNVQLPTAFGGIDGQAIYLDTEGSFMVQRVVDMVAGAIKHTRDQAAKTRETQQLHMVKSLSVEKMLEGILYFRIHHYIEQLAVINLLPVLLEQHPQVKLLVIDSVTFHFRQDFKDMAARTRLLTQMAQDLMKLAERHSLAVVLMNQVTTRVMGENKSQLVPALGESWGHAASTRVILRWHDEQRYAHVVKSPSEPPGNAMYCVTAEGIRSPPSETTYDDVPYVPHLQDKRTAETAPADQPVGAQRPRLEQ